MARIALLTGGASPERDVAYASASQLVPTLRTLGHEVAVVDTVDGPLEPARERELLDPGVARTPPTVSEIARLAAREKLPALVAGEALRGVDLVVLALHGGVYEGGPLQALLDLAGLRYTGSGALGSAMAMDKEVSKRLLAAAGLPVVPWVSIRREELRANPEAAAERALRELGLPVFVKPANLGSSVGISKVKQGSELVPALFEAARYDRKLLVERAVDAREIEVALLGNDPIEASVVGEIRTRREWYDYEAKYVDEDTELLIPAPIDEAQSRAARELAIAAAGILEGAGLARVDFLLDRRTGALFVNEVNSLPGFTEGSMYPRLWEASGLPYAALLDRLIELALERHREKLELETLYRRS